MKAVLLDSTEIDQIFEHYRTTSAFFAPLLISPFGGFNENQPDERAEMASLLFTIQGAGDRFTLVSLGAAPGEWAVKAERAYRASRPNGEFQSYCVEGDLDHYHLINRFIEGNGASLGDHNVSYRVVADRDGFAYFPIINPDRDWGAGTAAVSERADDLDDKIVMSKIAREDRIAANDGKPLEFRTVEAVSLATLFAETGRVDYLHSDIQGAEADVFTAAMEALNANVRVCCIATHGREIEQRLKLAFEENGWTTECLFDCHSQMTDDGERVTKDGVYVWSNPRFGALAVVGRPAVDDIGLA